MAWMENKLIAPDLLAALQMANRGNGSAGDSTYERLMKQEALKQEQMKSLLAQNEYEQQTGVPTITVPGMMGSGGSFGNEKRFITDLPGQVSGQRQSTYGQQVHEGNMQTGKLMASMGEAAADANTRGQLYGGSMRGAAEKPTLPNSMRGYGVYPQEASGIKDLLAEAKMAEANARGLTAQRGQWDQEYKDMKTGRDALSSDFDKYIGGLERQGGFERQTSNEIASTQAKNDTQATKDQDNATRQERVRGLATTLTGDPVTDKTTLSDMASIAKVTVSELINSEMYRNLKKRK